MENPREHNLTRDRANSGRIQASRAPVNRAQVNRAQVNRAQVNRIATGCDMTPMVDVTFLLLIFFVVTASFQLQKAVSLPQTPSNQPSRTPDVPAEVSELELRVDRSGSFRVLAADWQSETPSKQSLITQLKRWRSGQVGDTSLLVCAEHDAQLQLLVDAMDAGTLAGFQELRVESVEDFP